MDQFTHSLREDLAQRLEAVPDTLDRAVAALKLAAALALWHRRWVRDARADGVAWSVIADRFGLKTVGAAWTRYQQTEDDRQQIVQAAGRVPE